MDNLEEQNLIEECRAGHLEKFGPLYDLYADKIYRYIYFRVRHTETAQDLTSQAFFKALEGISGFNPSKGNFSSWLYRIARNNLIDHWRGQKNHFNIDQLWDLKAEDDIAGDAEVKEKIRQVKEVLARLENAQREIIIMKIWDGLSHKEISQILGKSEAGVKMMFSRAMGKLRKEEILALIVIGLFLNYTI